MELTLAVRRQVTARLVGRYQKASKAEKSAVLDQLCQVNGWHRDHARKALRRAAIGAPSPRRSREPLLIYGREVIDALRYCWAVLDGPSGKRLAAALPQLVASLRAHGELVIDDATAGLLCAISAATIDRRLAPDRAQLQVKGTTLTRPGSMLKSKIPLKTWAEWDDTTPGFVEIDLVGHDGGDNNDQFCYTLCVTDVATGWTCARSVGAKVTNRYDTATTPARRLLGDHPDVLCDADRGVLLTALDTVNPAQLRRTIGDLQNRLVHLAKQRGAVPNRPRRYHVYDSGRKLDPLPPK
jgi:hypothetical protein